MPIVKYTQIRTFKEGKYKFHCTPEKMEFEFPTKASAKRFCEALHSCDENKLIILEIEILDSNEKF